MMMRDENGAHVSNIEASLGDAAGHTITSIDNINPHFACPSLA
jgi:hypothetical protein